MITFFSVPSSLSRWTPYVDGNEGRRSQPYIRLLHTFSVLFFIYISISEKKNSIVLHGITIPLLTSFSETLSRINFN